MKTPHLATAMLASAAMIGSGPYLNDIIPPSNPARHSNGRYGINQRQRRKDRRRAFAAGNRKAFAK